ncbi:MAG: ImmA/IrrE family metallo-endopeptidase [Clostridia bacterium]|nr:ImmA/IrrE family metallo-endopeptidase [Clostridia bacterium]
MNPKEIAQHVLLEHGISGLPFGVGDLSRALGITAKLTKPFEIQEWGGGIAHLMNNEPYIFVDPSYCIEYQKFTAAHEIGHILLGHLGSWTDANGTQYANRKCNEAEANAFAEELTMPECVLMSCGITTVRQIKKLCRILPEDSKQVVERVRQRLKSGDPFTPTEQQLVRQFADYIQQHTKKSVCRKERAACATNS